MLIQPPAIQATDALEPFLTALDRLAPRTALIQEPHLEEGVGQGTTFRQTGQHVEVLADGGIDRLAILDGRSHLSQRRPSVVGDFDARGHPCEGLASQLHPFHRRKHLSAIAAESGEDLVGLRGEEIAHLGTNLRLIGPGSHRTPRGAWEELGGGLHDSGRRRRPPLRQHRGGDDKNAGGQKCAAYLRQESHPADSFFRSKKQSFQATGPEMPPVFTS